MKLKINPAWFLLIIFLMMFHGCVMKAQGNMQARECYRGFHDEGYEKCTERITYFSALSNFKEVFQAWD